MWLLLNAEVHSCTDAINAQRVLGAPTGKSPCMRDAIDPSGAAYPFTSVGDMIPKLTAACDLTETQADAFEEATRLGFPTRGADSTPTSRLFGSGHNGMAMAATPSTRC